MDTAYRMTPLRKVGLSKPCTTVNEEEEEVMERLLLKHLNQISYLRDVHKYAYPPTDSTHSGTT
jgi:hypothetical protein